MKLRKRGSDVVPSTRPVSIGEFVSASVTHKTIAEKAEVPRRERPVFDIRNMKFFESDEPPLSLFDCGLLLSLNVSSVTLYSADILKSHALCFCLSVGIRPTQLELFSRENFCVFNPCSRFIFTLKT